MFQLVTIVPGREPEPFLAADGKPHIYMTGQEAGEAAKAYSIMRSLKIQPRRIPEGDDAWITRELSRFLSGEYRELPKWFPHDAKHYAHHSTDKSGMISFTEGPDKGAADRQTRIKPGAYVARYFTDMSQVEVTALAERFAGEFEANTFLIAKTAAEIETVYTNGPNSCMSGTADRYSSCRHPVRVYAAGDLAVAYLSSEDNCITARCLIWPEKKRYSRFYGDSARLRPLLESAGYVHGYFDGARLVRVEYDGGFVMPYLDGTNKCRDAASHLVIDAGGEIDCTTTSGVTEEEEEEGDYCEHCEERRDPDSFGMVYTRDNARGEEFWCDNCIDGDTWTCEGTGNRYSDTVESVTLANDTVWSTAYFADNGSVCEGSNEAYANEDMVQLEDGTLWSQAYFDEHGFVCPECGNNFSNEDRDETFTALCTECAEARRNAGQMQLDLQPSAIAA